MAKNKRLEEEIVKLKKSIEEKITEVDRIGKYKLNTIEGTIEFKGTPFNIGVDGTVKLTYSIPKP
jgi:hypothetical protein